MKTTLRGLAFTCLALAFAMAGNTEAPLSKRVLIHEALPPGVKGEVGKTILPNIVWESAGQYLPGQCFEIGDGPLHYGLSEFADCRSWITE